MYLLKYIPRSTGIHERVLHTLQTEIIIFRACLYVLRTTLIHSLPVDVISIVSQL